MITLTSISQEQIFNTDARVWWWGLGRRRTYFQSAWCSSPNGSQTGWITEHLFAKCWNIKLSGPGRRRTFQSAWCFLPKMKPNRFNNWTLVCKVLEHKVIRSCFGMGACRLCCRPALNKLLPNWIPHPQPLQRKVLKKSLFMKLVKDSVQLQHKPTTRSTHTNNPTFYLLQ